MNAKFFLRKIFFLLALLSLIIGTSFQWVVQAKTDEQGMDYAQIDAYVQKEMQDAAIPGLAYGIVKGQEIVRLQAFGTADSSGRLVTPQTPFLISSVGKNITALAIQQLA